MSVSHGVSLGLFFVACIVLAVAFGILAFTTGVQLLMLRRGELRFLEASPLAQALYQHLFPDDGDAGGCA